jgi:hypothetical protein
MTTALALTLTYLVINIGLVIWVERERAREREVPWSVSAAIAAVRWVPPVAGAIYLVVVSGDWQFVLLVIGFFAISAWLLTGLLAYTNHGPDKRDRWRRD